MITSAATPFDNCAAALYVIASPDTGRMPE